MIFISSQPRIKTKEQLSGVVTRLDDPDTGLAAINRRLDANTGAVIDLERRIKGYADMYNINFQSPSAGNLQVRRVNLL